MSTNRALFPDLNQPERKYISRLAQIVKDSEARRERERNWKEYETPDRSMIVSYEVVDQSYDDEFGRVEKYSVEIRRVMADVTLDENYSGLAEDIRIKLESDLAGE